ncbi:hypothetical protein GOP47_0018280 [Adiantum capillus-veneris]|uniref:Uncharacterized protein n=1 Tax=Adiantum capillus-veneris TaxID=13818 RepID=A0A9D4UHG5_ADICA|nr:hypothetical protein GOP47_0018280 [Adiantum capillus-veneris]
MSEDSIASDSISCRTEANAPSLPPRKRLLAGLKQNGWSSPSSSSCAAAPAEPPQITETLAHTSTTKADNLDQNCADAADRGSLQSLNGAAESVDSHNKGQRKPKRQRTSPPMTMKKSSKKKKKKISLEAGEHVQDDSVDDVKASLVLDKIKPSIALSSSPDKVKDEADVDAVASKISSVVEGHSIALVECEVPTTANGDASPEHAVDLKLGSNRGSVLKEEEEVTCDEARKPSRNPASKIKKGSKTVATASDTKKRRRNPNRQNHSKSKETEHKKHEVQRHKMSHVPLPLADEELARQLHRAMNSSPRIARCLNHKDERPLLTSSHKHFQGS